MSGSGRYLLDADAFICLRALKILDWLRLAASSQGPVVITEYVAMHELSTLAAEIDELKVIDMGIVAMDDARECMYPWNDRRQQMGRPTDFTTFDETFQRRLAARWSG